ncbi:MAG TPA: hypothetical protein IAA58_05955 [Candidatus Gallacutalibacter stercoravium]|nr:hypothetical protein [Candidatus Gallacutalibacter stercoravium]
MKTKQIHRLHQFNQRNRLYRAAFHRGYGYSLRPVKTATGFSSDENLLANRQRNPLLINRMKGYLRGHIIAFGYEIFYRFSTFYAAKQSRNVSDKWATRAANKCVALAALANNRGKTKRAFTLAFFGYVLHTCPHLLTSFPAARLSAYPPKFSKKRA